MAKVGKEKLDVLINQMSHYDPDNMEMAAKRLSELILSGDINLDADEKTATQVRQAYMKQIQSQNDTVQSQAIKYLADIVPKLPSDQVEIIFEKILEYIINLNLHEKKRERYGACAATVIHQAAEQYGHKLENLFLKSISRLLQFKDKKTEVEIILISIITEFIKKWPIVASQLKFDRNNLIIYLLKNIEVKSKLDIIKKSEICLGKLTIILNKDLVNTLLNEKDWGLIRFIERNKTKDSLESLKQLRNGLLCLAQIIRTNNVELRFWVKGTALLLVDIINHFKATEDIDNIEPICDILDAALTALSYIIKTFSRELRDLLETKDSPFSQYIVELLNFNVEGMMGYAGEPMQVEGEYEEDQEYYEQAEADQKCWKVRRAALSYIAVLAKFNHNLLDRIGEGELVQDLGNKLVQQHSMVSEMAFTTFNELIELISIDRALTNDSIQEQFSLQRVKSSALDVADNLIREITKRIKIIFNNTKFNDQLKIESSKILLRIIQIYNHILINNQSETFSLVGFILEELKKTSIVENKFNLLSCLRELISSDHPFNSYERVQEFAFDQLNRATNIKIQGICISILRRINETFAGQIDTNHSYYGRLINFLKSKIKEFDSDKLIKLAILKCVGSVFAGLPLSEQDTVYFLEMLSAKLKIEVEKLFIVETIARLNQGGQCSAEKAKILEQLTKQIAENLGSNNYDLNIKSIQTISKILAIIGNKFSEKSLQELLEKSKHLLNDGKIPSFFKSIVDNNPKLLKPYSELIIRSTEAYYISKLIASGVTDTPTVIKIFKGLDLVQKAKKISLTLGSVNLKAAQIINQIDQSNWGRILIGALGYIGTEEILPTLFKLLETSKADENRYAVCSAIGNIVSRNQGKLVGQLMQTANSVKDVYLYIYIFKEMISFNSQPFAQLNQLIQWLLLKSQDKFQAESNYFITSECVGKLAFISDEAAKLVIANAKSSNENRRLIIANSLRFGLEGQTDFQQYFIRDYIQTIIQLLGDEKVRVREGAVKSLIAVAQVHIKGLKEFTHDKAFWKTLILNSQIHDQLIVVIDYGLCKEVRDQGKNLRLESFNLLQILINKVLIEGPLIEELMAVALHRIVNETSNDIVLKRLTVLRSLCQVDLHPFIRLQDEFVRVLGMKEGVFKKYQTKPPEDERAEIFLKGVLQEISELNALVKDESIDKLGALMLEYRNNAALASLIDNLGKK